MLARLYHQTTHAAFNSDKTLCGFKWGWNVTDIYPWLDGQNPSCELCVYLVQGGSLNKVRVEQIELAEHADEIYDLYYDKEQSYAYIGRALGERLRKHSPKENRPYTREAIRLVLNAYAPDRVPGKDFRKDKYEQAKNERQLQELVERLKEAVPCVICGCWVIRRTGYRQRKDGQEIKRTCSTQCSQLWTEVRYKLDNEARERQRKSLAKSILKKPGSRADSEVKWAKSILTQDAPVPNRTYSQEGSKASEAMEQVKKLRNGS